MSLGFGRGKEEEWEKKTENLHFGEIMDATATGSRGCPEPWLKVGVKFKT